MPTTFGGKNRYLASGSTATDYQLTAGNKASLASGTGLAYVPLDEAVGLRIWFFGAGSDGQTFSCTVWGVITTPTEKPVLSSNLTDFDIFNHCIVDATLSTAVGAGASTLVTSSERYADTLVLTAGANDDFEAGYQLGETVVYSPANNTPACLIIPALPANGVILDFDMTGATNGNALWERVYV